MFQRIARYFREARAELARVNWPNRQEVIQSTEAVLLFAVFSMVILAFYDLVFSYLARWVVR
jgi:preprotein translocase subunit SecE